MAPWRGPRHRSWASDTNLSAVAAVVVLIVYFVWEAVSVAPQGMVTLVGLAGGALFGAVSGDRKKKDGDRDATAERAVVKADHAEEVAIRAERKADAGKTRANASDRRADAAEKRERGWSQHRDHGDDDDDGEGE